MSKRVARLAVHTLLCVVASAAVCGCAGSGSLELISLNFKSIDPPAPRGSRLKLDHCYWWQDESGQVWIAMERKQSLLPGDEFLFVFNMSLVLEKMPAGAARNYMVSDRALRAAARIGPAELRFTSEAGALALYRESGDRLRGSFRLRVARQYGTMLGGWSRPARYLMQGTFIAVPDEARGRQIAAATEESGFERGDRASDATDSTEAATRPTPGE